MPAVYCQRFPESAVSMCLVSRLDTLTLYIRAYERISAGVSTSITSDATKECTIRVKRAVYEQKPLSPSLSNFIVKEQQVVALAILHSSVKGGGEH